jgi:site-specific DNA recombinase
MELKSKKTGIIYCRVSSAEQVENTSLESQERNCREYAKREDIDIIANPFIEEGESAKTADRTQFNKAIAFCSTKTLKVDYFIVYKVDRFSRNQEDYAMVKAALRRYGTELRSATEPINETSMGKLMGGVLSSFAEFDNNVRTERSKGGMMEQLKKGIWPWPAPVGFYRVVQGSNITPHPEKAPYILLAFQEWSKGTYSYESLAKHLGERGFRTATGKMPCAQLLDKILKNPLYCGVMRVWGEFEGAYEPIVSKELFDICQSGKKLGSKLKRSKRNPDFPLTKCICLECQKSLTASSSTGRNGMKYPHYHHQKQGCLKAKFIPKETFEQLFVEHLNEITPDTKYEKIFKAIVLDIWQNNYKKLDENNARVRKEISRLEQERQKVFDMHRAGKYSDTEFIEQKDIINTTITQKHQLIHENRIEEFDMEEALAYCFDFVRNTAKTWLELKKSNYDRLMRFQKQIFPEKITFDGEKFGNTKLSLIYNINKESRTKKSEVVTLPGIEPGLPA